MPRTNGRGIRSGPGRWYSGVILREMPSSRTNRPEDVESKQENEYAELKRSIGMLVTLRPEQLLLLHPRVRWGRGSASKHTTPELQVEEAQALCQVIPQFRVVSSVVVNTDYDVRKKMIWGMGRLEAINKYRQQHNVSAIFINVDMLSPLQQHELSIYFGLPVYDRYSIVLNIFKMYAKTREARLQIALAEIPYVRERVKFMNGRPDSLNTIPQIGNEASSCILGSSSAEDRLEFLRLREHKIRKQISSKMEATKKEVQEIKEKSGPAKTPVIGVIGYTNAGKTTLIKKLTDSQTLFGEDRLFATLDTTTHHAILPSASRVILADTIGFIMDLPVKLFLSFSATLQHVENADLLIHVMDLAHPDLLAQRDNVFETLQNLRIRQFLIDSIVNVGNKLDKCDQARKEGLLKWGILPQGDNDEPNYQQHGTGMSSPIFPISCRTMEGMSELIKQLDKSVQLLNGNRLRRLQLAHSSKAIPYLYEHGFIRVPPAPTECGNYLLIDVNMNDEQFSKFRTAIGTRFKRKDGQK